MLLRASSLFLCLRISCFLRYWLYFCRIIISKILADNDTDKARTYFLVNFPIHPVFVGESLLKSLNAMGALHRKGSLSQ